MYKKLFEVIKSGKQVGKPQALGKNSEPKLFDSTQNFLEVCNFKDNTKILYALEWSDFGSGEDKISAYFYKNPNNLSNTDIEKNFSSLDGKDEDLAEVGYVSVSKKKWLDHIEVTPDKYKKHGIGTQLIKLAIDELGLKHIACVQESDSYKYSLTEEGQILIYSCVKKGIVSPSMCFFSNNVPREGGNNYDPQYDWSSISSLINGNSNVFTSKPNVPTFYKQPNDSTIQQPQLQQGANLFQQQHVYL